MFSDGAISSHAPPPPPIREKEEPEELSVLLYPDNSTPPTKNTDTDTVLFSLHDWYFQWFMTLSQQLIMLRKSHVLCFTWLITSCWQWHKAADDQYSKSTDCLWRGTSFFLCVGLGFNAQLWGLDLALGWHCANLNSDWCEHGAWAALTQSRQAAETHHLSAWEKTKLCNSAKAYNVQKDDMKDRGLSLHANPAPPLISMQKHYSLSLRG